MSSIIHHGHFVIITSYSTSVKWGKTGLRRMALIEVYDPTGPLPTRIDPRLKNYKRLILIEEGLNRRMIYQRLHNHFEALAQKFETYWPLHTILREWPLPREVYFEWPDHLQGLDQ